MKIAIINLTGGDISGGYRTYLKKVIPLLSKHSKVESVFCAAPESWQIKEWFLGIRNVKFVNCSKLRLFGKYDLALAKQLDGFIPDVVFVPVERSFTYKNVPVVNMLQNMEPFIGLKSRVSDFFSMELLVKNFIGKMAIVNSDRIIAISGFVRDFLIDKWRISAEKIDLVYHGFEQDANVLAVRPEVLSEDISKKFIFTAGSIRPARGLEDVVIAAKTLDLNKLGIKKIVVAGKPAPNMLKYKNSLLNLIKANGLTDFFVFTGQLSSSQMSWCYENCRAFVMSSRVESFGMIAVEAMSRGCISIAAENPCLPEIFQDAAVYYKPKDAIGLGNIINSTLRWQKDKKDKMSQKAKALAGEFSWTVAVDRLVSAFELAISRKVH